MTFVEAYTSLKVLYKNMMFPKKEGTRMWTPSEIDQMDVHFFNELLSEFDELNDHEIQQIPQEKEVYLSQVWS